MVGEAVRVEEFVFDIAVVGAELVQHFLRLRLQPFEVGRELALKVYSEQHRLVYLLQHFLRVFAEGVALLARQVGAQEEPVSDHIHKDDDGQRRAHLDERGGERRILLSTFIFHLSTIHFHPSALPHTALQHHARTHQEEGHDADEIEYIARIDHTAADALIVVHHTQPAHEEFGAAEDAHPRHRLEAQIGRCAKQRRKDECHYLILRQRRAEDAYRHEGAAKQQQAYVRARHRARVDIAHRVAQRHHAEVSHQRRQQRDQHQRPRRQKLRPHYRPVAQRTRHQHLYCPCAPLFGQASHRDGRYQKEIEERPDQEEPPQVRIAIVQYIEVALEHPQHQARQHQEDGHCQVARNR